MAGRRKRKVRTIKRIRKINVFWPVTVVLLGLMLIGGSLWIYKKFSESEKIQLPKFEVGKEEAREINLYFADLEAGKLVVEKRQILEQPNLIKEAREIVEQLIRGPRNKKLSRTLPSQVRLRSFYVDFNEATAYIDFTGNIVKYSSGGSAGEILSVYSIGNSVIDNFSEIKLVKILINGEEAQTLIGHIDLTGPIGYNEGIVGDK